MLYTIITEIKRILGISIGIFILSLVIPVQSSATTYDGRNYTEVFYLTANGAGARNGLTPSNAFSPADFNNSSTWANPKQASKIGPGDCVVLLDDAGPIRIQLTVQKSGLPGAPITIMGETGKNTVIFVVDSTFCLYIENKSYIDLKNFTVRGAAYIGKHYPGDAGAQADNIKILANGRLSVTNINLTNITSEYAGRWGFEVASGTGVNEDCDYITFTNCTSRYNTQHGFHVSQNIPPSSYGVQYWFCKSYENGGYGNGTYFMAHGFACYGGSELSRSENIHYYFCEAFNNHWTSVDHEEGFGWLIDSYSHNVTLDGCYSHNNDADGFQAGWGSQDVTFRHCIASNNGKNGFTADGTSNIAFPETQQTKFYNCTSAKNGAAGFRVSHRTTGIVAINCISAFNTGWGFGSMMSALDAKVSNSFVYDNGGGSIDGKWALGPMVVANTDPLLVNASGTYSQLSDFTLQVTSPVRGKGNSAVWQGQKSVLDIGQRALTDANGNVIEGVDIGAFKYGPLPPTRLRFLP